MQKKRNNVDDELNDDDNDPQLLQQWEQLDQGNNNPYGDNEDLSSNAFDENTPSKKKHKVNNMNKQVGYGDSNMPLIQRSQQQQQQQYIQPSVPISPFSATSDV